jgi:hypothetical protein
LINDDITGTDGNETDSVAEVVHWDEGHSDDEGVFI